MDAFYQQWPLSSSIYAFLYSSFISIFLFSCFSSSLGMAFAEFACWLYYFASSITYFFSTVTLGACSLIFASKAA